MVSLVLCDTNIWLDYYLGARRNHELVREFIIEGCRQGLSFMVPSSCLGDFFYLAQVEYKRALREVYGQLDDSQAMAAQASAWANLEHLLEFATVIGIDHGDTYIAMKYRALHGDYEDDLVIAAALRANVGCLVTDDEKLRFHSPVLTLSVTEAIAHFGIETSAMAHP